MKPPTGNWFEKDFPLCFSCWKFQEKSLCFVSVGMFFLVTVLTYKPEAGSMIFFGIITSGNDKFTYTRENRRKSTEVFKKLRIARFMPRWRVRQWTCEACIGQKKKLALNELTRIKFWATVKYNEADVALALCSSEQRGEQTKSADCGIKLALQWWEVNVVIIAPMLAML